MVSCDSSLAYIKPKVKLRDVSALKRKEFASKWSKFFPFEDVPFSKEKQNTLNRVVPLESAFPLLIVLV